MRGWMARVVLCGPAMTKSIASLLFLAACATDPRTASGVETLSDNACPDNTPAQLAPAADQDLDFKLDAVGVQIYSCNATGAWVFVAPDAQLYAGDELVGHHYAGPTWEYEDGSTVVAAKLAGVTVDASAIPWLLLGAKSHNAIDGRMTRVSAVQRLETAFGTAPAGACTPGDTANVPYTATYFFYRTKTNNPSHNTRCGA